MSSTTANTATTTQTTETGSGMKFGLIIGGIVLAVILVLIMVFVIRRRRAAIVSAPTSANGLGVSRNGTNITPPTNFKVSSGPGNNTLRPPQ